MSEEKKETRPQNVHQSIEMMTEILAKEGIQKKKGQTQEIKYAFRGIDDIRNAIAPHQKACALNIYPRLVERVENDTRRTKSDGFSMWVVLKMEYDFVNTIDGSVVTVPCQGEAVDYSDKATQKAMSQAYKTVCINVFNIPTEGEEDADGEKKEFKGGGGDVFDSPELRKQYVENCRGAFEKCDTLAALSNVESFYHDKLVMMRNSKNPEDVKAGNELAILYKSLVEGFKTVKGKL